MNPLHLHEAITALKPIHARAIAHGSTEAAVQGGILAMTITVMEMLTQNESWGDLQEEAARLITASHDVMGTREWFALLLEVVATGQGEISLPAPPLRLQQTSLFRGLTQPIN